MVVFGGFHLKGVLVEDPNIRQPCARLVIVLIGLLAAGVIIADDMT